MESWTKAFPDPSNSPAHYTRTLTIHGHHPATAGADTSPRIRSFYNIVHLYLNVHPFALFCGLSPVIRSLRLEYVRARTAEILDFMCSFPLLEDLALVVCRCEAEADDWTTPSNLPRLTGSLALDGMVEGIGPIVRRLSGFQDGLHFAKIALVWVDGRRIWSRGVLDLLNLLTCPKTP